MIFNVIGSRRVGERDVPVPEGPEKISIDRVNNLSKEEFVERFGTLFQDGRWVAEETYGRRPFGSAYELRRAFQDTLFDAPPERQMELVRRYPHLGSLAKTDETAADIGISPDQYEALTTAAVGGVMSPESIRDQSAAGLDRLSPEEYEAFQRMNESYREKFGFPLIMAVRGQSKEVILSSGETRMENSPAQERATALVEVAKIANLRLQDLVEEPLEEAVAARS